MARKDTAIGLTGIALIIGATWLALRSRDPDTNPLDQIGSAFNSLTDRITGNTADAAEEGPETVPNNGDSQIIDPNSDTNPQPTPPVTCGAGTIENVNGLCVPDPARISPPTIAPATTPNPPPASTTRPFGRSNNLYNYLVDQASRGVNVIPSGSTGGPTRTVTPATRTAAEIRQTQRERSVSAESAAGSRAINNRIAAARNAAPAAMMNTRESTQNRNGFSSAGNAILRAYNAYREANPA